LRVLVMGAAGQLGSEVVEVLRGDHEVVGVTRTDADITDLSQVMALVEKVSPQVIPDFDTSSL